MTTMTDVPETGLAQVIAEIKNSGMTVFLITRSDDGNFAIVYGPVDGSAQTNWLM